MAASTPRARASSTWRGTGSIRVARWPRPRNQLAYRPEAPPTSRTRAGAGGSQRHNSAHVRSHSTKEYLCSGQNLLRSAAVFSCGYVMREQYVRETDERDFADFARAASTRMARMAMLLVNDQHLAEDLVQTSLVKAYQNWSRISGDPFCYVRRIMVNQRTDWWRRRLRRTAAEEEHTASAGTDWARHDIANQQATRDALIQAMRTLTHRERGVIVLRYFEDMSEEQTAEELGIACGTVKSTAHRALTKLRVHPDLTERADNPEQPLGSAVTVCAGGPR